MRPVVSRAPQPVAEGEPLPPVHDRVVTPALAIEQIYRAQRPALLRFVARLTARDGAEDIVQTVFARLLSRKDDSQNPIGALRPYLRETAHNQVCDEARQANRRSRELHIPFEESDHPGLDPLAALEARDRLARIEQAVLQLKPLTRQVFLACRLDGYSYAEIAQQTGLSVRGVEKQMSRALKQLGRHLRAHD